MVQAGMILLYLVYISIMIYIIFKYHDKTKKLKTMNDSFLMAIHDIKNYSVNIDASNQILQRIAGREGGNFTYNVLSNYLEVMTDNCREMNGLIENYSKAIKFGESHRNSVCKEEVISLVEEAVNLSKYYAKKKNIDVEVKTKWAEKYMDLDKEKVIRILSNLIMNGIKYSYEGGRILITILGDDDWTEIRVIDRGKGMNQYELKRVFDKHYRANSHSDVTEISLGMGLYSSRHLAGELGGDLSAESIEGKGSIFVLKLPMKRVGKGKIINLPFDYSTPPKKTSI